MQPDLLLADPGDSPDIEFQNLIHYCFAKGVRMNNWQNEFLAEDHRRCILQEVEQIRLEKLVCQADRHPPLFAQTMVNVGNWMISTGRQLRQRYEVPTGARI